MTYACSVALWQVHTIQILRDTFGQIAYITTMENEGWASMAVRNQGHKAHRKEQFLSYSLPTPQNPRNAYSATTATTPLQISPNAPEHSVASIADNPILFRKNLKTKHLRSGIIGDTRSPIIIHHVHSTLRNNCNNPRSRYRFKTGMSDSGRDRSRGRRGNNGAPCPHPFSGSDAFAGLGSLFGCRWCMYCRRSRGPRLRR